MAQLGEVSAINCTVSLPNSVAAFIRDSLAENTRKAYLSDLGEFEQWGGSIYAGRSKPRPACRLDFEGPQGAGGTQSVRVGVG
jgi:hypothetical protein